MQWAQVQLVVFCIRLLINRLIVSIDADSLFSQHLELLQWENQNLSGTPVIMKLSSRAEHFDWIFEWTVLTWTTKKGWY